MSTMKCIDHSRTPETIEHRRSTRILIFIGLLVAVEVGLRIYEMVKV